MNSFTTWLMTANGRRWIYGVAGAAIILLGIYGVVSNEQGIAWLALVAAAVGVAGPATALKHITPDPVVGEIVTDEDPEPGVVVSSVPDPEFQEITGSDPESQNL
jgi:hypothetical protein